MAGENKAQSHKKLNLFADQLTQAFFFKYSLIALSLSRLWRWTAASDESPKPLSPHGPVPALNTGLLISTLSKMEKGVWIHLEEAPESVYGQPFQNLLSPCC